MAVLFQATGGVIGTMQPSTTWAAPNGLFPTTDRNDSSAYTWTSSTSTVTLPSSGLADGYLLVAGFEFEDSSNGRHNPQARFVQASGSGTFVSAATGGYNRDNSEDRSYASTWAFVGGPSASSTYAFQWRRDSDSPGTSDGTVRSYFQVIPLYYADVGIYSSTSTTATGGTTPSQITGFTGTDGTNITISSSTVSVTGDNKRYLCLGGGYHQGIGGNRTQRWYGFRVDGTKDDAAKGCMYLRSSANADGGESFIRLLETDTATRTVDVFQYRGDGVSAGQGGADVDGNTTGSNSQHAMVVIELNDNAEVYSSVDSTGGQEFALAGPVDVDIASTADIEFNDSASFTRSTDTGVNIETDMDVFVFANVSHARESGSIGSGSRWTVHGEFTVNGTENTSVGFHGNYNRGNQSSQDTHGSSTNMAAFLAVSSGDDVGVSNQELSGTEGGGGDIETQPGWVGFGLINLDTLEASADLIVEPTVDSLTFSSEAPTVAADNNVVKMPPAGSLALTGVAPTAVVASTIEVPHTELHLVALVGLQFVGQHVTIDVTTGASPIVEEPGAGSLTVTGQTPDPLVNHIIGVPSGSLAISSDAPSAEIDYNRQTSAGSLVLVEGTPTTLVGFIRGPPVGSLQLAAATPSAEITHNRSTPAGSLSFSSDAPTILAGLSEAPTTGALQFGADAPSAEIQHNRSVPSGSLALTGITPTVSVGLAENPGSGSLQLNSDAPSAEIEHNRSTSSGALTLSGIVPTILSGQAEAPTTGALQLSSDAPSAEIEHNRAIPASGLTLQGLQSTVSVSDAQSPQPSAGSLLLASQAPSAEIDHFKAMPQGSMALSSDAPSLLLNNIQAPSPAALVLSGQQPSAEEDHVASPGSGSCAFTGETPVTLTGDSQGVQLFTGSLLLDGRGTDGGVINGDEVLPGWGVGLVLKGYAPTLSATESVTVTPAAGSLTLSGQQPQLGVSLTVEPGAGSLVFTGNAPSILASVSVQPSAGSLTLSSAAVTLDYSWVAHPPSGSLILSGIAPTVSIAAISPTITPAVGSLTLAGEQPAIEVANSGKSITNPQASTSVPNNYEQCDFSGFRQLPGSLKLTWNKYAVRKKSWEERHPQDHVRSTSDRLKGPKRPEQDDRFIGEDIDEITGDDL